MSSAAVSEAVNLNDTRSPGVTVCGEKPDVVFRANAASDVVHDSVALGTALPFTSSWTVVVPADPTTPRLALNWLMTAVIGDSSIPMSVSGNPADGNLPPSTIWKPYDGPEKPLNPLNPEAPSSLADCPLNPENPLSPAAEVPDMPENPEKPDSPAPAGPLKPEFPDSPENPDAPSVPENPDAPEFPEKPEVPDSPENPLVP